MSTPTGERPPPDIRRPAQAVGTLGRNWVWTQDCAAAVGQRGAFVPRLPATLDGDDILGRNLLPALFFQSNRHRTYAQHLEQGFLQPQDRAPKPPPGETFLPTFPGFPAILRLGSRSCVRLAIHVSALPAPRFTPKTLGYVAGW